MTIKYLAKKIAPEGAIQNSRFRYRSVGPLQS